MTRTDLFDDLDPTSVRELKAGLAGRVARQAGALREERVILYAGANILSPDLAAAFAQKYEPWQRLPAPR